MTDKLKTEFAIGIDLGTTNCALSFVRAGTAQKPQSFEIPQWETNSTVVGHKIFPSFYFLPVKSEWKRGQLRHVWNSDQEFPDYAVGRYAKFVAATQPGRVIHSAKSWICHGGVSRNDRILPWHSDELIGDDRRSPVEVSAAFLQHLRHAWNYAHVGDEHSLERQIVTITVPASFDETAQALTLRAAQLAGIPFENIHLLEEPQAAFYSWLNQDSSSNVVADLLASADEKTILICDIGGGTSDFSLFKVRKENNRPAIERIAVSEHLLLAGDNIDLAIAYILEPRLTATKLSSKQWAQLVASARQLKERALSEIGAAGEELHVALAAEGSSLFAKTLSAVIKRAEILDIVLSGFFPVCGKEEFPRVKDSGLRTLGLPYADDSAVTKYLAKFLAGKTVDAVLFTGGTLIPKFLQLHLLSVLTGWQSFEPRPLANDEMDLAVSLGAAAFGATFFPVAAKSVSDVEKIDRIKAGYPRSVYLELAHKGQSRERSLLCIVPKGFDGHTPLRIDSLKMQALVDAPVRFQLFTSTSRDTDQPGTLVKLADDEFHPLNPLHTVLKHSDVAKAGKPVDVALEIMLMSTGMLQLSCVNKDGGPKWPLEFNVRDFLSDGSTDNSGVIDAVPDELVLLGIEKLAAHFGKKMTSDVEQNNPKYLVRALEEVFGRERKDWDIVTLRKLWPHLKDGMTRKGRSVGHEVSWLYLSGYCLRPGYGVELDEWRVNDLWKAHSLGIAYPKERQIEEQWWIMWRRVAGGLTRDQQERIFDKVFPAIKKGTVPSPEVYMLAGSLERIEMGNKVRLGSYLVQQIAEGRKQFLDQKLWALGRIASRVLMHGNTESIVRPVFVEEWFKKLENLDIKDKQFARLANFLAQAARIVNDREFDLAPATRLAMIAMLEKVDGDGSLTAPLRAFVPVDAETKGRLFGEELPSGLILHA